MRRISIFSKIIVLNLGLTVVLIGCVLFACLHYISVGFDEQSIEKLATNQNTVDGEITDYERELTGIATALSKTQGFADAVFKHDADTVQTIIRQVGSVPPVEFITVSDAEGNVIARSHSDKRGDSVKNQYNVKEGLAGKTTFGIEEGTVVKFSLRAGHPVYHEGKLVGVICLGLNIASNKFVDGIKKRLGVACTLFKGDMRISTTIMRQGKRAIGTKMDNPKVIQTVLVEGKTFKAKNTILGIEYDTLYWPLIDIHGKIAGMYFIGVERTLIEKIESDIFFSVLLISGIVALLIIAGSAFFAKNLSKPIVQATRYAQKVAKGHLEDELSVKSNDEVGLLAEALGKMVESLKQMIAQAELKTQEAEKQTEAARQATEEAEQAKHQAEIAKHEGMLQAANQIDAVMQRLSSTSQKLATQIKQATDGVDRQSARTTETATAMEQMNATVGEVARSASESASHAENAKLKALEGNKSVEQVIASIAVVNSQAEELQNSMTSLGSQAEDIGRIMQVIEDIADQTNLLALNAAIEAARAGEAGRGFAVVADEVRKLAEKTMQATKEVGQAIASIQEGARKSIAETQDATHSVAESTSLAEQSGSALAEIVKLITNTAQQVTSIATAAEEQSATSDEINRAVDEISHISDQAAELMDLSTQAVSDLTREADELHSIVSSLKSQ